MRGRLARETRALLAAAVFFSRLPVPKWPVVDRDDLRRAAMWWPLIGVITALLMIVAWEAARPLGAPVAAGVALAAGVVATGALTEDGLADVCDGFGGGGRSREAVLRIMHESRLGACGVIALGLVLGLRWQALAALPPARLPGALLVAMAVSRSFAVLLMAALPYLRQEGSRAHPVVGRLSAARLGVVWVMGVLPCLLGAPLAGLIAAGTVLLGCVAWFGWRIGGYTGDCVGATQQAAELAVLLAAVAA
jgi:adenosylcobinamide-GDP ribazoletransferase